MKTDGTQYIFIIHVIPLTTHIFSDGTFVLILFWLCNVITCTPTVRIFLMNHHDGVTWVPKNLILIRLESWCCGASGPCHKLFASWFDTINQTSIRDIWVLGGGDVYAYDWFFLYNYEYAIWTTPLTPSGSHSSALSTVQLNFKNSLNVKHDI